MTAKTLLAVLAGAIVMYVWASVAHMSPLAMTGFQQLQNEGPALAALQTATANKPGLYKFPYVDMKSKTLMKDMQTAVDAHPSGILIYHPPGVKVMTPAQLGGEFAIELFETLLAVWLMTRTGASTFGGRVGFMAGIGVLAAVVTNGSYWIWYGYPTDYTLATMAVEFGKFLFAGIAAALVLGLGAKKADGV